SLLPQVPHRVVREGLERLGHATALLAEGGSQAVLVQNPALGEARPVAVERAPADRERLAVVDLVEQVCARGVDQLHAAADKEQRAGIRELPALRGLNVDHDPNAGLNQLLGRYPVE